MANKEFERRDLTGDAALAASPAADRRSDLPDFAAGSGEIDLADTTSILHGAQAATGKAVWSAGRMAVSPELLALYEQARQEQGERDAEGARELAHLAEWNSQMTNVGGVEMTNEEAQVARRHVADNADAYADEAIAKGEIGEGNREAFTRWARRKIELEDKRGRGTISGAEDAEERKGDASRVGHSVDAATAHNFQSYGAAPAVSSPAQTTNKAVQSGASTALDDYSLFQAAAASKPNTSGDQAAAPLSAKATASGLNL